jgi:hypothetical protein
LKVNGYPGEHIINLGDEHHPSQEEIIQRMIVDQPTSHVLVVGFVNIHTHQAEEMLEYFEHEAQPWALAGDGEGDDPAPDDDESSRHGFTPADRAGAGGALPPPGPRPPSIRHISV